MFKIGDKVQHINDIQKNIFIEYGESFERLKYEIIFEDLKQFLLNRDVAVKLLRVSNPSAP